MNYLLDTPTCLWALMAPHKLSVEARQLMTKGTNDVHVSVVSFWEISLKYSLRKLDLKGVTPAEIPAAAQAMGFVILPMESEDAASYHMLCKTSHRDPFDRMIAWQSIRRQWPLISSDRRLDLYKPHGLMVIK